MRNATRAQSDRADATRSGSAWNTNRAPTTPQRPETADRAASGETPKTPIERTISIRLRRRMSNLAPAGRQDAASSGQCQETALSLSLSHFSTRLSSDATDPSRFTCLHLGRVRPDGRHLVFLPYIFIAIHFIIVSLCVRRTMRTQGVAPIYITSRLLIHCLFSQDNRHQGECPRCPNHCPSGGDGRRLCWNADHCQKGTGLFAQRRSFPRFDAGLSRPLHHPLIPMRVIDRPTKKKAHR